MKIVRYNEQKYYGFVLNFLFFFYLRARANADFRLFTFSATRVYCL